MHAARRPRVLLVEDEADARGALARALSRAGYDVIEAADVSTAIARTQTTDIDAAVLDIVLGDRDRGGLEVLETLRERSSRAPVTVVTAFADVQKVKDALNLGASHLIEKPFRAAELVAIVERLVSRARALDPASTVASAFERANLTPREAEVARLALKGLPSPEIAHVLGMSEKTVRQHLSRVYEKHGVSSRGELFHLLFPI